jgi:hypothetical protein
MTPEAHDAAGWLPQVVAGLGLSSTAMGAWILKTSNRQVRIEQKLCDMEKRNQLDHADLKAGIKKVVDHITGTGLG